MRTPDEVQAREFLRTAFTRFSHHELAIELGVSVRRIERWARGGISDARLVLRALSDLLRTQPIRISQPAEDFTFSDLFAGIGGTRLAFQGAGGRCVFTSEYDRFCVQTYRENYRPDHEIVGDIRSITQAADFESEIEQRIPAHDILVAGFPCQPFSIAGVSKKNALGRAHGFECKTQGTLFFDICRILEIKRPLAFMLENVRNLKSHDGGRTFDVIMDSLNELGYSVYERIIDAKHWVPQHRERIFIVGFRNPTAFNMDLVNFPQWKPPTLADILHPEDGSEAAEPEFTKGQSASVNSKYVLTSHLWNYLQRYKEKHEAAGNGFGFGLVTPDMIARTLSARYYKDGSEILISRGKRAIPRRLTPRECARLMGFPGEFRIPVSDTQAYKQFGNSVVVPAVKAVANAMKAHAIALKQQESVPQFAMVV